ncbi:hypothetical protein V6N13_119933 [Hibiscus sabdariffa]
MGDNLIATRHRRVMMKLASRTEIPPPPAAEAAANVESQTLLLILTLQDAGSLVIVREQKTVQHMASQTPLR